MLIVLFVVDVAVVAVAVVEIVCIVVAADLVFIFDNVVRIRVMRDLLIRVTKKKKRDYGISIMPTPTINKNPTKTTERSFWSFRSFLSYMSHYSSFEILNNVSYF